MAASRPRWVFVVTAAEPPVVLCEAVERMPGHEKGMRWVRVDQAEKDPRLARALKRWRAGDDTAYEQMRGRAR